MQTHQSRIQKSRSKKGVPRRENAMPLARGMYQRPTAIAQAKREEIVRQSPQVQQLKARQEMVQNSSRYQAIIQRMGYQASSPVVQRMANKTGLPSQLKSGVESLSGISMDDVKVHYNSTKPAQLQAHAYAQGTNIHLGPGQEKHLPHEAWHVVQQKQGRVQPTMQMKDKVQVNDDAGLEREADLMGAKAMMTHIKSPSLVEPTMQRQAVDKVAPIQFALPPGEYNTERLYEAQPSSKGEIYGQGRPAKFSVEYKQRLLEVWKRDGAFGITTSREGQKEYIRTVTDRSDVFANWVPIDAFQIDHKVPWDKIAKDLFTAALGIEGQLKALGDNPEKTLGLEPWERATYLIKNNRRDRFESIGSGTRTQAGRTLRDLKDGSSEIFPTLYAARMYYHDYENLQPMQGSENAGKGASLASSGSTPPIMTREQMDAEAFVTRMYLSIMDSVQHSFAELNQGGGAALRGALFKRWGKGGDARKALESAVVFASSKTTGAPGTPMGKPKLGVGKTPSPMAKPSSSSGSPPASPSDDSSV